MSGWSKPRSAPRSAPRFGSEDPSRARLLVPGRLVVALVTALLSGACGGKQVTASQETPRDAERAVTVPAAIVGTTVDASTGKVLGGVRVELLGGAYTVSDEEGRFALRGLPAGKSETLVGTTEDGLRREQPLRPLAPGRSLEVVLRLTKP